MLQPRPRPGFTLIGLRHAAVAIAAGILIAGCVTQEIDLGFQDADDARRDEPSERVLVVGQFSDRRGKAPFWIGDIYSRYRYPKTALETREPVASIVRRVVEQSAASRNMVSARGAEAAYQLSGEIFRLEALGDQSAEVHVEINIRLTLRDGSKQVYQNLHRIDRVDEADGPMAYTLTKSLEESIAQAVADALDDAAFRQQLRAEHEA